MGSLRGLCYRALWRFWRNCARRQRANQSQFDSRGSHEAVARITQFSSQGAQAARIYRVTWANRTVLSIGLASLFSDVGHEMATTAMPVLLASMGASSAVLGVIEGLADGTASFAKLGAGL
jgi:hypothetical protein